MRWRSNPQRQENRLRRALGPGLNRAQRVPARAVAQEDRQASARVRRSGVGPGPGRPAGAQGGRPVHSAAAPGSLGADPWAGEAETASDRAGRRTEEPGQALQVLQAHRGARPAEGSDPVPAVRTVQARARDPMARSPGRSGRRPDRRATASAHGEDPAARPDDTVSPHTWPFAWRPARRRQARRSPVSGGSATFSRRTRRADPAAERGAATNARDPGDGLFSRGATP